MYMCMIQPVEILIVQVEDYIVSVVGFIIQRVNHFFSPSFGKTISSLWISKLQKPIQTASLIDEHECCFSFEKGKNHVDSWIVTLQLDARLIAPSQIRWNYIFLGVILFELHLLNDIDLGLWNRTFLVVI